MSKLQFNPTPTAERYSEVLNQITSCGFNVCCTAEKITITHPLAKVILYEGDICGAETWIREDARTKHFWSAVLYLFFSCTTLFLALQCDEPSNAFVVGLIGVQLLLLGAFKFIEFNKI